MISIRQLDFKYFDTSSWALQDISLEIGDGTVLAVLGANGSGKSTLARLLGGLLTPTKGSIIVDGVTTTLRPPDWAMHQHIGMVFQNPQNQIVSTVVENEVAFGLENLQVDSVFMQERVTECLALVGLSHLRTANPHELSAGEQQRLAICSALVTNPRHLILDEATSLLDDQTRSELMTLVRKLASDLGLGIILITHRMDEVSIADEVIVLARGLLVFQDTPAVLFAHTEKLTEWNLTLPPLQEMIVSLQQYHIPLPRTVSSVQELAGLLWP